MDHGHPPIVDRETWLRERVALLEEEKALTRAYDRLNAKRRRLPMVKVEESYVFDTKEGEKTLLELFEGRRQLLVYHFMYGPDWKNACPGCTSYIDAIGDLSSLATRDATFVIVSRARLAMLEAYRVAKGWPWTWVSSGRSRFNIDFGVSIEPGEGPGIYNYRETERPVELDDRPGLSVFFRIEDEVYHTYSTYQRGGEALTDSYRLLDVTPWGRQEDFEDSPPGWPQRPTYG